MHPKSALFDECIEVLNPEVSILTQSETKAVFEMFKNMFPIRRESRVYWKDVPELYYRNIDNVNDICTQLQKLLFNNIDTFVFILWNDADIPVVVTSLYNAIEHIDYITCVASDTWLLNTYQRYVVEFYHLGEMRVGIAPDR